MKVAVGLFVSLLSMSFLTLQAKAASPADFSGTYRILQTRLLALTNGRGYVLQDGSLVADASINPARVYCRAGQSRFDELAGTVDVAFSIGVDGFDHALLRTVPTASNHRSTTIDCVSQTGFTGALDITIALGRIVELSR